MTFTTNPKAFEKANYLLAMAIDAMENNPANRKKYDLSETDIKSISVFRKQMVEGFRKSSQ